jgi:beta-lactam-binding protein with PASTA domain
MFTIRTLLIAVLFGLLSIGVLSCEKKGPAEKAVKQIDQTVEKAGDKMEEAGEAVKEKTEEAKEEVKKKTEGVVRNHPAFTNSGDRLHSMMDRKRPHEGHAFAGASQVAPTLL